MSDGFAPIVLFTYNRLKNTRETVDCLLANEEAAASDLIVYSDAPKSEAAAGSVAQLRDYLRTVSGFRSVRIVEREENYGLVRNIVSGVTETVNRCGRVIVLEDDHSVSPYFLRYMNEGLDLLADRQDIACIHGYVYPHKEKLPEAFLIKGADCWGWGTWKRAWDVFNPDAAGLYREIVRQGRQREFEFNGSYPYMKMLKNQMEGTAGSWAICWYASAFLSNLYTVYPDVAMVRLNSLDDGGEHSSASRGMRKFSVSPSQLPLDWGKASLLEESPAGRKAFERFFWSLKSWRERLFRLFWKKTYLCQTD